MEKYTKYLSDNVGDISADNAYTALVELWGRFFHPMVNGKASLLVGEREIISHVVRKLNTADRQLISCVYNHITDSQELTNFAFIKATHEGAAMQAIFAMFKEAGTWTQKTLFEHWKNIIVRQPLQTPNRTNYY
jgi:hypothetical protein